MTRIPGPLTAPPARTWTLGTAPWQAIPPASAPRARVIIDNDFSGDPDDLYQLVHHLLSPSVEIPLIVASHLRPGDHFDPSDQQAENAHLIVQDVFARMGLQSTAVIQQGSNLPLEDRVDAASGTRSRGDHRGSDARRCLHPAVLRSRRRPHRPRLGVARSSPASLSA